MSSFAFSHQFSQRWLATHPPVKYAIIQELDDIATLLQPETELHDYEFTVPNLHEHIESLMVEENKRKEKERIEAERIEQLRQEAIRREEIKREQERQEKIRLEKEALEQQRLAREREEQAERERLEKERQEALIRQKAEEERQAQLAIQREQLKAEISADLSKQMEDYIQLSLKETLEAESQKLRNELKPWLEQEVEKQLAERWEVMKTMQVSETATPQMPVSADIIAETSATETPEIAIAEKPVPEKPVPEKPVPYYRSGKKNRK